MPVLVKGIQPPRVGAARPPPTTIDLCPLLRRGRGPAGFLWQAQEWGKKLQAL